MNKYESKDLTNNFSIAVNRGSASYCLPSIKIYEFVFNARIVQIAAVFSYCSFSVFYSAIQ